MSGDHSICWACGQDVDHNTGHDCPECGASETEFHKPECEIRWRPTEQPGPQSTVAAEAHDAVHGPRSDDYGHPSRNFADIAALWSVLLGDRLTGPVTPEDVARCMIAVKLARDIHSPKRDNRVDLAGYAITLDRLATGQ